MSINTVDDDLWEWPLVAYPFVIAIALPLVCLEILDMARIMIVYAPTFKGKVVLTILIQNFALLPAFAVCTYSSSRRGLQGAYLAILGACAAVIVCFNFRGDYVRFGTFDLFEISYWSWLRFLLFGSACGVVAGLFVAGKKPLTDVARPWLYWIAPLILVLTGIASYWVKNHYEETSMFAPTRFYALIAIGLLLLLIYCAAEIYRRNYEAKSIYSH